MYIGIYSLSSTQYCSDGGLVTCNLQYDSLEVTVRAMTPRRAVWKANRAMAKELLLREEVKDFMRVMKTLEDE